MKRKELEVRLRREGVPSFLYSFDDLLPEYEGLVLTEQSGSWIIEYCEMGECRVLETLNSEEEACTRVYDRLIRDFLPFYRAPSKK